MSNTDSIKIDVESSSEVLAAIRQLAGKYMIFKLADEEYGLEILKVRELIGLMPITLIPGTKPFIRGVINLRGRVIPVVDLRLKFGLPRCEASEASVIIVVQYGFQSRDLTMGILVDEVVEVLNVPAGQIEPPPDFGGGDVNTEFILGVGKADRRVICLLDIGKVLNRQDTTQVVRSAEPQAQRVSGEDE